MSVGFLGLPWFGWAGISLVVAILYSFVWPRKRVSQNTGFRFFILRWGHALVWILLAINFMMRGFSPNLNRSADFIALAGGAIYLAFMFTTFIPIKK